MTFEQRLNAAHKLCKGCGKQVIFLQEKATGKTQILDVVAPTYDIWGLKEDDLIVCQRSGALVSHFATCPNANDFSGGKKVAPR